MRIATMLFVAAFGAPLFADTLYVNDAAGNDAWDGRCEVWDGGACGPKKTIQFALFVASHGDEIIVADGVYTGEWNKNIDFGGLAVTLRSANGPAGCIIDCENDGRGFQFRFGEGPDSVVKGFTIRNGDAGPDSGGAILCTNASSPTIAGCVITSNEAMRGGGIAALSGRLNLLDSVVRNNTAGWGGGLYLSGESYIDRCAFSRNDATNSGGAIMVRSLQRVDLRNLKLTRNTAAFSGGGITVENSPDVLVSHCTLSQNAVTASGGSGGAMYIWDRSVVRIYGSVLWGNGAGLGPEIALNTSATAHIDYSDVWGGFARIEVDRYSTLDWGLGNLVIDPAFVDPTAGNFRLSAGSPCIDMGDPGFVPGPGETDLAGRSRVWGGRVDMGSFEHGSFRFGDMNCDGATDALDIEPFIAALFDPAGYATQYPDCELLLADLNGDGSVDALDIERFIGVLFP